MTVIQSVTAPPKDGMRRCEEEDCMLARLSPEALQLVAEFFKVLSEASRLQIVCTLRQGSKNVSQIIEATGLGQANVSKHLKILAQAGIVTREQQGVCVFYRIVNPFVFDLCELVCNSLSLQIQQQAAQQTALNQFRQTLG